MDSAAGLRLGVPPKNLMDVELLMSNAWIKEEGDATYTTVQLLPIEGIQVWRGPMTNVATLKPKKTQGQTSIHLATILGKKINFSRRNPTFPEKNSFLSAKISDDLFLLINSHFQIFARSFQSFTLFRPKSTTKFLKIPYFKPKST